ncbi:type IV pilus twitching motility protein PilT [Gehongia tenuis]|uniref:Type IV pilus twitching motility protein PilT n=1 Tax=Gehongia tenuis TaxID=2763655 RepID=A0A926HNX0_9FIRM|nr:type IV pilus twitching motility protein PilT [Gehongia tenuis]MBC8531064.1 type IV pilus twitching motility protein PilT [Gehongia tenuis]
MTIDMLLFEARKRGCSDVHLTENMPAALRVNGKLAEDPIVPPDAVRGLIMSMLSDEQRKGLERGEDQDFAWQTENGARQRVNVYRHRLGLAAAIRLLTDHIPSLEELHLPPVVKTLADQPRGLILVTGPTGSGKSTTLAAMIDHISRTRSAHIMTVEDPIEYVFQPNRCIVHQREVGSTVSGFAAALRSALREDPDIILVGEMRDYETISTAVTAAETGHLVLSTLHTTSAAQTIDRIVDTCPAEGQRQMRTQLSALLRGVVTQQLVPLALGNGRAVATEILLGTDAVGNLIRENKCHQLATVMQSGAANGMQTLSGSLAALVRQGAISRDTAFQYAADPKDLRQYIQ